VASLHAAKGLEWDVVFLPGLTEGNLPIVHAQTGEAVAEERRLLYVGVTRARERVYLSWALAPLPWWAAVPHAVAVPGRAAPPAPSRWRQGPRSTGRRSGGPRSTASCFRRPRRRIGTAQAVRCPGTGVARRSARVR
jgi:DNA helicase-2/ATP-dependent DNA helicase PcrA